MSKFVTNQFQDTKLGTWIYETTSSNLQNWAHEFPIQPVPIYKTGHANLRLNQLQFTKLCMQNLDMNYGSSNPQNPKPCRWSTEHLPCENIDNEIGRLWTSWKSSNGKGKRNESQIRWLQCLLCLFSRWNPGAPCGQILGARQSLVPNCRPLIAAMSAAQGGR